MGSEAEEAEASTIPKLPLLSIPAPMVFPEPSGMLTPPLHTTASVPFLWEEEPGKPRPCTALVTFSKLDDFSQKCLEPPPRMFMDTKITKLPSPTTVLEGPYMGSGRLRFQSSSLRMTRQCYGSFRDDCSPERGQLGAMVLSKRGHKEKGFFGSWGRRRALKGKRDQVGGGSYVFPSSVDGEDGRGESSSTRVNLTRITRKGSFSDVSHAKSHFWATVYEGLKQVGVPWRSRRVKKDGS